MLQFLSINNLALIEKADFEFESGFITVTGETGAGKSILLGALSFLAGNRVSKSMIRQGAESCEVEATLHLSDSSRINAFLQSRALPETEDGELLICRSVHQTKAGKIRINGTPATAVTLRELGELWIDFHGPGEPQKLFNENTQLEMLDLYSGCALAADEYRNAYRQWKATLAEISRLKSSEKLDDHEADFIRQQLSEFESVTLTPEYLERLETDFTRLDRARELSDGAYQIANGLIGERGTVKSIAQLLKLCSSLERFEPAATPLKARLDGLSIEASDLAGDFRELAASVDFDPSEVERIQQEMKAWLDLKRRYGPTLEGVLEKRERLRSRLAGQGNIDAQLHQLEQDSARQKSGLHKKAEALTQAREQGAEQLAATVRKLLLSLGFKKPQLHIAVHRQPSVGEHGNSTCAIQFSANPGQEPLPLSEIASSGEAARVMLALKTVLAEIDRTPVLVFDEVDANIGGETGLEVGRELARLGNGHQVFCVTHLPQVAAHGIQHFGVSKLQTDTDTRVTFTPLHTQNDSRLREIARMLGDSNARSAQDHASELIQKARKPS